MEEDALAVVQHTHGGKIIQDSSAPEIAKIRELRPTTHSKVLEARVYRKWISVTYGKKDQSGFSGKKKETGYCCILIDQEGNAIQANMDVKEIDYFSPKIKLGSVYRISEFVCEPTSPYQQTISNKTSLRFGRATKFDAIEAPNIPLHYFEFASYNQLQNRIPKEDATGKMQYPILIDYMGCLRSPGEVTRKPNANQSESVYRKVDIENLSGNVVEFTMWDDMAEGFEDADFETMQQPIIIAVSSCRVTKFRDYQLTATSATRYYLNPQIPEADEARARYKEKHQKTPPLRITKTPYEDIEKEKFRNRFPLKTLLKQDPESYAGVRFTSEATVTSINIKRDWFYVSCNQCASKVKEEDGMYRCLNHGKQQKPSYRYIFKGFITDPSATIPITFFSPAADDITGYSCSDLLAKHKAEDPQEIPPEIFTIEGEKNIFQFHFNTLGRTTDFNLDQVFNKKKGQEGTSKLTEANLGTPPTPLALTNQQAPEPKKDEEGASKTAKRPLFQHEPADAKRQKGAPPTPLALTNQQAPESKKDEEGGSKTAKRPLFQHEPAEAKRQKATIDTSTAEKERTKAAEKKQDN